MNRAKIVISLILVLAAGLATTGYVSANPSSGFREIEGEVFDDWEICRTRASGEDGFYQISETSFRPVIAFESLGRALPWPIAWASSLPKNTQTRDRGRSKYSASSGIGFGIRLIKTSTDMMNLP